MAITLREAIEDCKLSQVQLDRLLSRINQYGAMLSDPAAHANEYADREIDETQVAKWFSAATQTAALIGLVLRKDAHTSTWFVTKSDTPWLFFDDAEEFRLADLNATYDSYIKSRKGKKQDALEAELERKKASLRSDGIHIELVHAGREWAYMFTNRIGAYPLLKYLDPFVW
jgi:hypothetical protein